MLPRRNYLLSSVLLDLETIRTASEFSKIVQQVIVLAIIMRYCEKMLRFNRHGEIWMKLRAGHLIEEEELKEIVQRNRKLEKFKENSLRIYGDKYNVDKAVEDFEIEEKSSTQYLKRHFNTELYYSREEESAEKSRALIRKVEGQEDVELDELLDMTQQSDRGVEGIGASDKGGDSQDSGERGGVQRSADLGTYENAKKARVLLDRLTDVSVALMMDDAIDEFYNDEATQEDKIRARDLLARQNRMALSVADLNTLEAQTAEIAATDQKHFLDLLNARKVDRRRILGSRCNFF